MPDRSGTESSPDIIPRGRVRAFTELFLSARTHGRFLDAVEAVPESSIWLCWFHLVSVDFGFTAMTQGFGSNLCQSSQRKREAQLQAKKKLSRDRRRQFHHSRRSAPRTSSPDRPRWRRRAARSDARTWTRTPGARHPAARAISPNPSS